jgi:hypothetical protein
MVDKGINHFTKAAGAERCCFCWCGGFGKALTGADKKSYFLKRLRYAAVINRLNSQTPVTR